MAIWNHRNRLPADCPVVIRVKSMLGNTIYEIASLKGDKWVLQNGHAIEHPEWILGWMSIPELPPEFSE